MLDKDYVSEVLSANLDALPDGRETDHLIATVVMGWKRCHHEGCQPWSDGKYHRPEDNHRAVLLPRFSTDPAAAWCLIEKYMMTVSCLGSDGFSAYPSRRAIGLEPGTPRAPIHASASTGPLAICRAALLAEVERAHLSSLDAPQGE
jgi:hypothetical protein